MAKSKSKSDIKITNMKKNLVVVKKGSKSATVNKKPRQPKKKLESSAVIVKNENVETELIKKVPKKLNSQTRKSNVPVKTVEKKNITEKKELTQEEIVAQRKARNRRKYQNQQKKYQDVNKPKEKKKIDVEDQVDEEVKKIDIENQADEEVKKSPEIVEEDLVKKVKEKNYDTKESLIGDEREKVREKEKERKEKRKTNHKSIQFTQTITTIKEISVSKINNVKEITDDKNIPIGKTKEEKVKRSRRLIKEAIIYSIILTIINVSCILIFDYFNFLRLFDVPTLNIVVTVVISLIFNFFVTFMIDYFITILWLKKKNKKKDGERDGDNWTIKEEHKEYL